MLDPLTPITTPTTEPTTVTAPTVVTQTFSESQGTGESVIADYFLGDNLAGARSTTYTQGNTALSTEATTPTPPPTTTPTTEQTTTTLTNTITPAPMSTPITDTYKLSFCYSTDGNSFTVEVPFIPLADIYVPHDAYSSLHNGKHIKAQDLKNLLAHRKSSIAVTMANLMHFDLADFVLPAGVYTPNFGQFQLDATIAAQDGKNYALSPDSIDCEPAPVRSRLIVPTVLIKDYYALLYLQLR